MNMKKHMKKMLALVLALVMVAGSSLTSLAAPEGVREEFEIRLTLQNEEHSETVVIYAQGVRGEKVDVTEQVNEAIKGLDWEFVPEQKQFLVTLGEETKLVVNEKEEVPAKPELLEVRAYEYDKESGDYTDLPKDKKTTKSVWVDVIVTAPEAIERVYYGETAYTTPNFKKVESDEGVGIYRYFFEDVRDYNGEVLVACKDGNFLRQDLAFTIEEKVVVPETKQIEIQYYDPALPDISEIVEIATVEVAKDATEVSADVVAENLPDTKYDIVTKDFTIDSETGWEQYEKSEGTVRVELKLREDKPEAPKMKEVVVEFHTAAGDTTADRFSVEVAADAKVVTAAQAKTKLPKGFHLVSEKDQPIITYMGKEAALFEVAEDVKEVVYVQVEGYDNPIEVAFGQKWEKLPEFAGKVPAGKEFVGYTLNGGKEVYAVDKAFTFTKDLAKDMGTNEEGVHGYLFSFKAAFAANEVVYMQVEGYDNPIEVAFGQTLPHLPEFGGKVPEGQKFVGYTLNGGKEVYAVDKAFTFTKDLAKDMGTNEEGVHGYLFSFKAAFAANEVVYMQVEGYDNYIEVAFGDTVPYLPKFAGEVPEGKEFVGYTLNGGKEVYAVDKAFTFTKDLAKDMGTNEDGVHGYLFSFKAAFADAKEEIPATPLEPADQRTTLKVAFVTLDGEVVSVQKLVDSFDVERGQILKFKLGEDYNVPEGYKLIGVQPQMLLVKYGYQFVYPYFVEKVETPVDPEPQPPVDPEPQPPVDPEPQPPVDPENPVDPEDPADPTDKEEDKKPAEDDTVKTGDTSMVYTYVVVMLGAAVLMTIAVAKRRNNR